MMGPLKSMGPGVIVPPASPLGGPVANGSHRCCDISFKAAVVPGRYKAEMGLAKLVTRFGVEQRV